MYFQPPASLGCYWQTKSKMKSQQSMDIGYLRQLILLSSINNLLLVSLGLGL